MHGQGSHPWIGVTEGTDADGDRVLSTDHNPLARWFHRDADRSLFDVLRQRGVAEEDARLIDGSVVAGEAVLVTTGGDPLTVEAAVETQGGVVRSIAVTEPAAEIDPLAESREIAAIKHPAGGTLDINGVEKSEAALDNGRARIPVIYEEIFVLRMDDSLSI